MRGAAESDAADFKTTAEAEAKTAYENRLKELEEAFDAEGLAETFEAAEDAALAVFQSVFETETGNFVSYITKIETQLADSVASGRNVFDTANTITYGISTFANGIEGGENNEGNSYGNSYLYHLGSELKNGYIIGVGKTLYGEGMSLVNTLKGFWWMTQHPKKAVGGVCYAVSRPIITGKSIVTDIWDKTGTLEGQGEIAGDVIQLLIPTGAAKVSSETAKVARTAKLAENTAEKARTIQKIVNQVDEIARRRRLGTDPARGGVHLPLEEKAAIRLELQQHRVLRRATLQEGGEWADEAGKIYDLVGPVPPDHANLKNFLKSIENHSLKDVDFIVVDTNGFSPDQIVTILKHLEQYGEKIIVLE